MEAFYVLTRSVVVALKAFLLEVAGSSKQIPLESSVV